MTNVAFIGLGIMGNPMAGHLAKAGHAVTGFNRHPNYDDLEAAGGKGAGSLEEAVADADVVCVMVPDSPDVRDVLEGEGGVFDSAKPGTLVVDFSSIRPDVTVELAKTAKERGFRLLDAPVSGGEAGAKNAACRSWSGVTPKTSRGQATLRRRRQDRRPRRRQRVRPDRQGGQPAHRRGQHPGAGRGGRLLKAYDVDLESALEVLGGGPRRFRGPEPEEAEHAQRLVRARASGSLAPQGHGHRHVAAREAGVVVPVAALVAQLMASALANGDGGLDHSGLLRGVERLSGKGGES
jgi:2-hydroxy-3-oxopropionate reductase